MTPMDSAGRIVAINILIRAMGLADRYGEKGGLLARLTDTADGIVIEDEAYAETFSLDVSDETLRAYLEDFAE